MKDYCFFRLRFSHTLALSAAVLLILSAFMVRADAQQKAADDTAECILTVKGKPPVGMREFRDFEVLPLPDSSTPSNQKYDGRVETIMGAKVIWYEYSTLIIKGRQIDFTTKSIRGVKYVFTGHFTRDQIPPALQDSSVIVVEGLVIKFRNNRKVAEGKLQFTCNSPVD